MSWNILKQVSKAAKPALPTRRGKTSSKLTVDYVASAAAKGCAGCPLNTAQLTSPKMPPTGAPRRETEVYILGEAPGADEDERGEQFVGASGRILRQEIPSAQRDSVRWNNVIRCFPGDTLVTSPRAIRKVFRRKFSGVLVTVVTANGRILSGTENHPVLSTNGWVPLAQLVQGMDLLCTVSSNRKVASSCPDIDYIPVPISEVFDSFQSRGSSKRMVGRGVDFHGDGRQGEVNVVIPDSELWHKGNSFLRKEFVQESLVRRDHTSRSLQRFCSIDPGLAPLSCSPFVEGSSQPIFRFQPASGEKPSNSFVRNLKLGNSLPVVVPGEIELDYVLSVTSNTFDGHVFTLETDDGWFVGNGIIVANCRPPANREPAEIEVECCRAQQVEDIARSKPRLILGFGAVPLAWLVPAAKKITAWRGRLVPVEVGGHACWFMPMLHPAYILRQRHAHKGYSIEDVFKSDIAKAFRLVETNTLPEPPTLDRAADKNRGVVLAKSLKQIEAAFAEAMTWDYYGIDIETSGLRPYAKDARILTVAVSNYDKTFALPIKHRDSGFDAKTVDKVKQALLSLLLKGGKPIAHNSLFELGWLAKEFGPQVVHEVEWHDTMAQAYVLDEREGAKSLEAVSLLVLGLDVKSLSRPLRMNDLDSEPLDDVLHYNAHDAKYCVPIFYLQRERIEHEGLADVYTMQNRRAGPLALMEGKGVVPDTTQAAAFDVEYTKRLADIERSIEELADVKAFAKKFQHKFSPSSNKDILDLFYHQLNFKQCEVKDGKKVKLSTDEDVLKQIDHPLSAMMLELRGVSKLRSTYIVPLTEGGKYVAPDGLVHATFKHLTVSTGRLASEDPNLQNFPRRDNPEIRRIIVAPPKHTMVACDYGQIEARVIACAAKCSVLIAALWEGYDIHGEWAERIAHAYPQRIGGKKFLKDKVALKRLRDDVKNGWTFPLFYGSVLEGVAGNLKVPASKLEPLYDEFWESFEAVHTWQEKLRKFYREHQYVSAPTGRRRHAPMSWNEIINTGIQGAASDIVVDALCDLSMQAYEQDLPQLQAVIDVHDDLTFYLPDATLEENLETLTKEMVRPRYSWIVVPVVVEVKVGKNWCDLEEVARVSSEDYGHKRRAA